jgi:hypothetical protein
VQSHGGPPRWHCTSRVTRLGGHGAHCTGCVPPPGSRQAHCTNRASPPGSSAPTLHELCSACRELRTHATRVVQCLPGAPDPRCTTRVAAPERSPGLLHKMCSPGRELRPLGAQVVQRGRQAPTLRCTSRATGSVSAAPWAQGSWNGIRGVGLVSAWIVYQISGLLSFAAQIEDRARRAHPLDPTDWAAPPAP